LVKNASVVAKAIARIERGAQLPLPATLRALADGLDIDLDVLAPGWSADILEPQSTDPVGLAFAPGASLLLSRSNKPPRLPVSASAPFHDLSATFIRAEA
jgi:transcriptional regulator with XRE-family HTH domain